MNNSAEERIKKHRELLYRAVKAHSPDLYRRAVEIGHLGLSGFIADENRRAAEIEAAVIYLIADIKGVDI